MSRRHVSPPLFLIGILYLASAARGDSVWTQLALFILFGAAFIFDTRSDR